MAGVNKCFIIGNLGRDPEVTYTQSGTAVAKITVATSETWNDKNSGEKQEKTEWHRITFFGKQAETIGKYMIKGSQIYIEGRLQTSQYEKDGVTRYSTDIIASNFQFIGNKQDGQQNAGQFQQGNPAQNTGGFQAPQNQSYSKQPGDYHQQQGTFQGPPDDQEIPF